MICFKSLCGDNEPRNSMKQYSGPKRLWVISLGLYIPPKHIDGTLLGRGCRGFGGPTVDKLSFNSCWSAPLRGRWSSLLKPLVRHCLSTTRWLHKNEVLCDRLQALLFCLVFSPWIFSGWRRFGSSGDRTLSWLLSGTVRWGLAVFQLCLAFPEHIPHRSTVKFSSPEHTLPTAVRKIDCCGGFCLTNQAVQWLRMCKKQVDQIIYTWAHCLLFFCLHFLLLLKMETGMVLGVLKPASP